MYGRSAGGGSKVARFCGWGVAAFVALAVVAGAVLAAPVRVQTHRISPPSPFSGRCTHFAGFSRGFAQENSVAVDPRDPRHVLVSWIQDGRATDLVMASRDGGRSFSRIFVPGLTRCTGGTFAAASDPGVTFSADGRTAYFSAIVLKNPASEKKAHPEMVVSRSFDGGFSWSVPDVVQPSTGQFWDLPRLTADPRRPNKAYYVYDLRKPRRYFSGYSLLSMTTNGGRSWSTPRKLYDPHTSNSWPGISKILVNRDGSLLDVFALISTDPKDPAAPNHTRELAIRSLDGGRTWSRPITIGRSSGRGVTDPTSHNILNTFDTYPSQTVAPNGDVYVAWLQPGATNTSSRIAVARSTDGGHHWTTRKLAVRGQAALPTIEVAGDGTVGVVYYVIAPSSRNGNWPARVALATSRDRGRDWNRRAVAGPFNLLTTGSKARHCCFLGDYEGIARLPHGLAAAFSMGRPIATHRVDAYFSRITTSW